jgi:hypothetical protein
MGTKRGKYMVIPTKDLMIWVGLEIKTKVPIKTTIPPMRVTTLFEEGGGLTSLLSGWRGLQDSPSSGSPSVLKMLPYLTIVNC